jgi:hypothetical protein
VIHIFRITHVHRQRIVPTSFSVPAIRHLLWESCDSGMGRAEQAVSLKTPAQLAKDELSSHDLGVLRACEGRD